MLRSYSAALATVLLAGSLTAHAQTSGGVGIGTTAPDASAALDVVSSDKGALLPRLTAAQRLGMGTGTAPAPAPGLLVYQTDAPATGAAAGSQPGFSTTPAPAPPPSGCAWPTAARP
jgi:hypothetical protein